MPCLSFSRALMHLFMFTLFSLTIDAAPNYRYHICGNANNFTANSSYQSNLNLLLSSLSSNATSVNGFYNSTAGLKPPDMVYGLFLCRGDITTGPCKEYIRTAAQEIVQRCPTQKDAIIWYDECMLRYSNQYIFATLYENPRVYLWSIHNITEQTRFNELLATTMDDIATRASNDLSGDKMFATKEANFSGFQKLYTLAQCTPDLSSSICNICLRGAIAQLPNCCSGKQGGRVLNPSCNVRYETYPFYQQPVVQPPTSEPTSEPRPKGKGRVSTTIAIAVPIAVSGVIFAIGCYFVIRRAKKKHDDMQEENVGNDITTVESLQFGLAEIQVATNNFSEDNKLGEGGFGVVYKGTLRNGQEIAVKRLSRSSGQGAEEFKNEIVLVAKLQHRNLVRLLGFCLEGEEKMLAYEFMPNKSLDYFLFDPEKREQLDWSRRYKIIGGIARGILYLHEDSQLRIIHRDLKASNILLDGDMNPKVSDFGMARIFGVDQTQGNTNRIVGTFGYMSPEYAMHGQFSGKSDVYSFGVLILEILSGKKNACFFQSDYAEDLLNFAWKHWRDGTPLEVLDPTLTDSYSRNEVIRCINIGLLCVQEDPADRPTMASIVLMLNSYSVSVPLPQQPAFFLRSRTESNMPTKALESDNSDSKLLLSSVNEASITEVYPR